MSDPDGGDERGTCADPDGADADADPPYTVRVRGIYATALTRAFRDAGGLCMVQASPPIERRFVDPFPVEPVDAAVETTDDRQGIGVTGAGPAVERAVGTARQAGRDALAWGDPTPRGAVFAGEVVETPRSGAVVDLGDAEGFLPYSKTSRHVEIGDRLRVQVREAVPPWTDARSVLDTTVRVAGALGSLVRGGTPDGGGPELADLLPTEPPEGWGVEWGRAADDADLDALSGALDALAERASALDAAFTDAAPPGEAAPGQYWVDEATTWVWFGRESRFGLDATRREVTATMAGHHRTKAGSESASAAVDLVEAVCPDAGSPDGIDFPFGAVTRQFGPREGDTARLEHGKPDGRRITLGDAEVSRRDDDGTVVVRREMSPGGTYDGLGVEREAGDVAVTKLTEGKWWYPTAYRSDDGGRRGTYVNVCTPVEVFPSAVRYVDLHVDVVKHADGTVERLDDDELDAAVEADQLPASLAEKARSVASALESAL
jgi:hypothetical protein